MEGDKSIFSGLSNGTRIYSPITLNREWSGLGRLVFIVLASCFGVTANAYFISSFFVERHLRRIGNAFLVCVGLADMMITGGIIPIAAVVLLSGVWDVFPVCQGLQFLTTASTYCYSMFFALVSAETYHRVCISLEICCNKTYAIIGVTVTCIKVFIIGIAVAAIGTYWELDYDYCDRRHFGNLLFRQGTSIIIHGTSFVITVFGLTAASIQVHNYTIRRARYRRSVQYNRDVSMIKLNLISYCMYLMAWMPYIIVVYKFPDAPDRIYYQTAALGLGRSLISSLLYPVLNSTFGRAYLNLFYYCCCKITMQNYPRRPRKVTGSSNVARPVTSDVRTHIMHHPVNPNNSQRDTSLTQETMNL